MGAPVRLVWKGLTVTNSQAYKDREFIKAMKSFKVQTAALGLSNLEGKYISCLGEEVS